MKKKVKRRRIKRKRKNKKKRTVFFLCQKFALDLICWKKRISSLLKFLVVFFYICRNLILIFCCERKERWQRKDSVVVEHRCALNSLTFHIGQRNWAPNNRTRRKIFFFITFIFFKGKLFYFIYFFKIVFIYVQRRSGVHKWWEFTY